MTEKKTTAPKPTQATASLDQFLDTLKRRKLLPEFHLGTVGAAASSDVSGIVQLPDIPVTLDGDTVAITAQSVTSPIYASQRVAVVFVPPSGYHIVGTLGVVPAAGTCVYYEAITTLFTTAATTTEQAVYTTAGTVPFYPGYAYFVEVWAQVHSLVVAQNPTALVRETSLTGTQLLGGPRIPLGTGNLDARFDRKGYVVNTSGFLISQPLVVTMTPQSATALAFSGTVGGGMFIKVTVAGPAVQFSGVVALT